MLQELGVFLVVLNVKYLADVVFPSCIPWAHEHVSGFRFSSNDFVLFLSVRPSGGVGKFVVSWSQNFCECLLLVLLFWRFVSAVLIRSKKSERSNIITNKIGCTESFRWDNSQASNCVIRRYVRSGRLGGACRIIYRTLLAFPLQCTTVFGRVWYLVAYTRY